MSEVRRTFERQTHWQKARQTLSWPEKIRLAEKIRESVRQLRAAPLSQKSPNVHTDHAP